MESLVSSLQVGPVNPFSQNTRAADRRTLKSWLCNKNEKSPCRRSVVKKDAVSLTGKICENYNIHKKKCGTVVIIPHN